MKFKGRVGVLDDQEKKKASSQRKKKRRRGEEKISAIEEVSWCDRVNRKDKKSRGEGASSDGGGGTRYSAATIGQEREEAWCWG